MLNENSSRLFAELNNYVMEMDDMICRMEKYSFPFQDIISTYADVSTHLHKILKGDESHES